MIKVMKIILTVLVTSFFFFPFSFSFFPSQNTKNLLAVAGFIFVIIELVRRKDLSLPRELLILLFLSGMVSLLSLISITYNQTPDTTYPGDGHMVEQCFCVCFHHPVCSRKD